MNSFLSRIRVVSFIVQIISIIFCCGYAYADESIAQAFVLTEENEIKGVSKYIDYIKKSDSEHVIDAILDVISRFHRSERISTVDWDHPVFPVSVQAQMLSLNRSSLYYRSRPISE